MRLGLVAVAKQAGGVAAAGELSTAGSCSTGRPKGSKLRAKESSVESVRVARRGTHYLQDKGTKGWCTVSGCG